MCADQECREGEEVMPQKFDKCAKTGGRVRTLKPKGEKSKTFVRVCYPKGGGSPVSDYPRKKK